MKTHHRTYAFWCNQHGPSYAPCERCLEDRFDEAEKERANQPDVPSEAVRAQRKMVQRAVENCDRKIYL